MLGRLDAQGLGAARARVAATVGDPDPFHVRSWLCAHRGQEFVGTSGEAITADAMDAVLLAAGAAMDGLLAGRLPGPITRAVPVDGSSAALRWPAERTGPVPELSFRSWTTGEIGDESIATIRCAVEIPGGVALGSDYGLTLVRGGKFSPFPWPAGSRREARRVEAMALHEGRLVVATSQTLYTWDFAGEPTARKHGADDEGGWDELRCLLSSGGRLLKGWRTRLEGGVGPPEVLSMAEAPEGVVYAGTLNGELHVVDGGGPVRRFVEGKGRPVRHLAFTAGALWVAAAGEFHRFDGAGWSRHGIEPTALAVDRQGRLWVIREGRLCVLDGSVLVELPVPLERPWCLAPARDGLWVGGKERVWMVRMGGV